MKTVQVVIVAILLIVGSCVFMGNSHSNSVVVSSPTTFSLSDTTWIASLSEELSDPYFQSEYGTHPSASFCRLSEPFEGYDISFVIINDHESDQIVIPFYRLLRLSDSKEFFICCVMEMSSYLYAQYGAEADSLRKVLENKCYVEDGIYYFCNNHIYDRTNPSSSDNSGSRINVDGGVMFQFVDVNLDGKKEFLINDHRDGSSGGCDFFAFKLDDDGASYCNDDIPNGWINSDTSIDTINKRLYLYDGFYTFSQGLYVYTRVDEMIPPEELPDTNMTIHFRDQVETNGVLKRYVQWAQTGTYFRLDSIYLRIDSVISFPTAQAKNSLCSL
ncbi:MAG: hypothetical protein MJZ27_04795 [Bacteroidales bacterium]|nr:hypothetical protein [Bacteroidales bacterium]